jgi:hypothetical protein
LLKQSCYWDFNTESTSKFSCLQQNSLLDGAGNFYQKNREFGRQNREFNPRKKKTRQIVKSPPTPNFEDAFNALRRCQATEQRGY